MFLIFARHGQTESGAENRYEGATDSPLTPLGKQQAKLLAKFCQKEKIKKIYSSPLGRALKTAREVAKVCQLKINVVNKLKEICYGEWEGKASIELQKLAPWQERNKNFFKFVNPGSFKMRKGESFETLYKRLGPFFHRLTKEKGFSVLIVSHVGVVRCAKRYFEKVNEEKFREFRLPNDHAYLVRGENQEIETQTTSL